MLRAIKVGVVYYNRRFESRRREMKKKNTKKNKNTVGARDCAVKRIFSWNPKESVISVIRIFRGIRFFRVFVIQKRNRNKAHAPLWNSSSILRAGRLHSQAA